MYSGKKTAIVLFNLGGPDKLESVRKFLFNLFNDKAIIRLPQPFRFMLAQFISRKREKKAQGIYKLLGGKSPLLDFTLAQAENLERELSFVQNNKNGEFKTFVAMRYFKPFAAEVVQQIRNYNPDRIILLPLYPQFSSTTSASSIQNFAAKFSAAKRKDDKKIDVKIICCYPTEPDFISSHANLIKQTILRNHAEDFSELRFLFSAHGLPQSIVNAGDPYVVQVEATTEKVVKKLAEIFSIDAKKIDAVVCFQSKVGRMQWTSPSLDYEIRKAALDKKIPVVVPISFVSDHSETLVELDIDYCNLAEKLGVKKYLRVPSLNSDKQFITMLKNLCLEVSNQERTPAIQIFSGAKNTRFCSKKFKFCPNQNSCEA